MQTPHGARPSRLHGSQQSGVWVQPEVKSGTQPGTTQTPVTSGFDCWQTRPGPHTAGGMSMLPAHGPPSLDTQRHPPTVADVGVGSHVERNGQEPPHVASAGLPHGGGTQSADGPGQQVMPPAVAQMHS
jgi:hypothetical protein